MTTIKVYLSQLIAAIRMSFADRTNFLLQSLGMLVNNLFFLLLWYMFFARYRAVAGWGLADVALLLGLTMTIVGAANVGFGGYRDLAAAILRGAGERVHRIRPRQSAMIPPVDVPTMRSK